MIPGKGQSAQCAWCVYALLLAPMIFPGTASARGDHSVHSGVHHGAAITKRAKTGLDRPLTLAPANTDQPRHPPRAPMTSACTPFIAALHRRAPKSPLPMLMQAARRFLVRFTLKTPATAYKQTAPQIQFVVAVDAQAAPRAANAFLFLSCGDAYTNAKVSRVVPHSLIQFSPATRDSLPASVLTGTAVGGYERGMVVLTGADDGSFFILLDRMVLPAQYAVVGTVSAGLSSLDRASTIKTVLQPDAQEQTLPLRPPVITTVSIATQPSLR